MAKFPTIPAFDWVVLVAWSGKMDPPSDELPYCVPGPWPIMGIVFSGRLTMSADSSSLGRLGIEHLTIEQIPPLSDVIFFDQQY